MTRRRKLMLQAVLVWKLAKIWGIALRIALRRGPGILFAIGRVYVAAFRDEWGKRKGGKHP